MMYISPMIRMSKIHIWMGSFLEKVKKYEEYFNQTTLPCQFCKDIGIDEYDEDFIGIIPLFDCEQDIKNLLSEVPVDENDILKVLLKCEELNIRKGNAIFYLTDSSISVLNLDMDYNQLRYIGIYNSSL